MLAVQSQKERVLGSYCQKVNAATIATDKVVVICFDVVIFTSKVRKLMLVYHPLEYLQSQCGATECIPNNP